MAAPGDTLLAMFGANAHQWGRSAMAGGRHGRREGWGHDRSAKAGGITALWSHCSGVTTMLYCAIRFYIIVAESLECLVDESPARSSPRVSEEEMRT